MIASVLVSLWTKHKPTRRMYEMLCFYFQGLASEEELRRFLLDLDKPKQKKRSKFSNNSSWHQLCRTLVKRLLFFENWALDHEHYKERDRRVTG